MAKKIPVIAVFDIGKTNKKLLVFDEQYQIVKEHIFCFEEIVDEDGFPCENLEALTLWVLEQFRQLQNDPGYSLKAVNFSTYGASIVYIDKEGKPIGSLYNYLKPYPPDLFEEFEKKRGGMSVFSMAVCTPLMGHLNAGMQLYWMKIRKQSLFSRVKHVLHFPQFLSYLITGEKIAEMTSLGCHSAMWNFSAKDYHPWLKEEGIFEKLSPVTTGNHARQIKDKVSGSTIAVGTGLHDSSAAMIPYLQCFKDPFMILSTGTWAVSLNPFNTKLSDEKELSSGCFSYLTYQGAPMKTSMLFSGNDHDLQVKRIATHFRVPANFFKAVSINCEYMEKMRTTDNKVSLSGPTSPCVFEGRSLERFETPDEAYHQLMGDLIDQQKVALQMVLKGADVARIYVDGGFCRNPLYMQSLANAFPKKQVFAASMIQGTALGAALALHNHWNSQPLSNNLVQLRHWPAAVDSNNGYKKTQVLT